MSLKDHKGSAYAFGALMQQAQDEIDAGLRKGVTVKFKTADWSKTKIGWFRRRLLRGEFRRKA